MSMTKRILRSPDTSIFSEDSDCRCYKDYNRKDNRDNTYIDNGNTFIDRDYDNSINDTYNNTTYTNTYTTYNNNTYDNILYYIYYNYIYYNFYRRIRKYKYIINIMHYFIIYLFIYYYIHYIIDNKYSRYDDGIGDRGSVGNNSIMSDNNDTSIIDNKHINTTDNTTNNHTHTNHTSTNHHTTNNHTHTTTNTHTTNVLSFESGTLPVYSLSSSSYKYLYFYSGSNMDVLLGGGIDIPYIIENNGNGVLYFIFNKKYNINNIRIYHPMNDNRISAIRRFTLYYGCDNDMSDKSVGGTCDKNMSGTCDKDKDDNIGDKDNKSTCDSGTTTTTTAKTIITTTINKTVMKRLKSFEYQIDGDMLQSFSFDNVLMDRIKIIINNNWGQKKYVAIYKIFLY